jgi:hypothetical protein
MQVNNHPNDNRWKELCQAILDEPDPVKLQELARMLNDELEAQEKEAEEKRSKSYVLPVTGLNKSVPGYL